MLETLTVFALKGFRCSNRAPSGEQLAVFPLILRGKKKKQKTHTYTQNHHNPVLKSKIISKLFSHLTLPLLLNHKVCLFHHIAIVVTRQHEIFFIKENDEHNEHEYKLLMFFIATFGIKDNGFSYFFNYFLL